MICILLLIGNKLDSDSAHLFVMIPRLGNNEGTFLVFESSCHLLLPVA